MSKFDELLSKLQENDVLQTGSWVQSIPADIWEEYFANTSYEILKYNLNWEEHRHYALTTIVIKIYGRILGIRAVTQLFSAGQDYESCFHKMEFFEMKKTTKISYKRFEETKNE